MVAKTRKHKKYSSTSRDKNVRNANTTKCRMKTCRAQKYKAIYGSNGGSIRSNIFPFY